MWLGPPGALLFEPLFWLGGGTLLNRLQKKVGTLILTSLLENLVERERETDVEMCRKKQMYVGQTRGEPTKWRFFYWRNFEIFRCGSFVMEAQHRFRFV